MSRKIMIEPVTRIEGHAKVGVYLDDAGKVEKAVLHINEFRGFEKFCEGRLFFEMPLITERICGICPVSHHLASVKACDQIVGIDPPRPAKLLRELMHMGQIIQSHAMHFFELAGPDLLLGFDADPAVRNVVGVYQSDPKLAAAGIKLRQFGQQIIAVLGERRVHPNFAVPGGVRSPLNAQARDKIRADLPEMIGFMQAGIAVCKQWMDQHSNDVLRFGSFPTAYLGMVDDNDALQLYDGNLRLVDSQRKPMLKFSGDQYLDHICERVESWSYLKFPYYKALGWPSGAYRVGPLARLNSSTHIASPLAQAEYVKFHALGGNKVLEGTLCYHLARLIEGLYALERVGQILDDAEILSTDIQITGHVKNQQGVGVLEAPRGTLIHHYWVNENGQIEKVNLIVATGHNNYAMTRAVDEVAKMYIDPANVTEGALNRIEAAIRAYDPCLSCSTHAVGSMPMVVSVYDAAGCEVRTWKREE
jgi:NAD-reducing hydrogenase large subunit